jgi:hypothetical protein
MTPAVGLLALAPDLIVLALVLAFGKEVTVKIRQIVRTYRAPLIAAIVGGLLAALVVFLIVANVSLQIHV